MSLQAPQLACPKTALGGTPPPIDMEPLDVSGGIPFEGTGSRTSGSMSMGFPLFAFAPTPIRRRRPSHQLTWNRSTFRGVLVWTKGTPRQAPCHWREGKRSWFRNVVVPLLGDFEVDSLSKLYACFLEEWLQLRTLNHSMGYPTWMLQHAASCLLQLLIPTRVAAIVLAYYVHSCLALELN